MKQLCRQCQGNGVEKFRGGLSECRRCGGDGWEPRDVDDFTAAQKWRFAQQEGELIAKECASAGIDDDRLALHERVAVLRRMFHKLVVAHVRLSKLPRHTEADIQRRPSTQEWLSADDVEDALRSIREATSAESQPVEDFAVDPAAEPQHSPSTREKEN